MRRSSTTYAGNARRWGSRVPLGGRGSAHAWVRLSGLHYQRLLYKYGKGWKEGERKGEDDGKRGAIGSPRYR